MSQPTVIVGAGGHARVVIEILREQGLVDLVGCIACAPAEGAVLGIPVLGDDTKLPELRAGGVAAAFAAIGDNRTRRRVVRLLAQAGFRILNAVSVRAAISPSAYLGEGVAIMAGTVVNAEARIGDGAIVNTGATVDHNCRIGDYAHIAPGAHLAGRVAMGEGSFAGIGSSIIPGVTVGPWTTIGAGAAVVGDLPAGVIAAGVPARIIRRAQDGGR